MRAQVFILKKRDMTMTVVPPGWDLSELSPRKQQSSYRVWKSDSIQFTDGDYVIM